MWRKVFCVISFLVSVYLLMSAWMQAWLTAAEPEAVEQLRLWAYAFLGLALLVSGGYLLWRTYVLVHRCPK